MRKCRQLALASTVVLAVALAACGGGSGGGLNSTPTPTPTPAPIPTPTPSIAGIGLTQPGDFSTLAINHQRSTGGDLAGSGPMLDPVQFRYIAGEQKYEILLPGFELGRLHTESANVGTNYSWSPVTRGSSSDLQEVGVGLMRPGPENSELALTFTSMGSWGGTPDPSQPDKIRQGYFVYGVPTAAGDVPLSGTGTYNALVSGLAPDGLGIGGGAELIFDFAAGSLSGHMRPTYTDGLGSTFDLGRYDFVQTVYGVGGTNFSGQFSVVGSTESSFFEGMFTGPQASELMARWQAPFLNPYGGWSTMYGVWVGKKQ